MTDTRPPDHNLITFPNRPPEQPEVLDGEPPTAQSTAAVVGVLAGFTAHVVMLVRAVIRSPQMAQARSVVEYRLRKAPRDVTRLCWFFLRGHGRWIARGWTWATHGHLRADARAAWLAGDSEARRKAQELIRSDARARWAKFGMAAHRITVGVLLVAFVGGVLAIIDARVPRADMWPWLAEVYTVLGVTGMVLRWVVKAVPVGWLVAAIWEGRDRTPGASWLVRPNRNDADSWVDERMISQALAHLGITPLDRFFKNGGELVYTIPARVDGEGTYAQIRLPMGVTADMVAAKRTTLAANLGRAALETWPTQGPEAGILDLWIADKGKLGGGAGPWPLLHEGTVDVFEGVPIGKTQRGQVIYGQLFERNWIVGGRPGQGKTALVRLLVLGAALDPTAELWVFVIAQNTDFDPFAPRLARYQVGMGPDVAAAAVQALADLFAEMERRGKLLATLPGSPPATSRRLADKPALGLHPLICVISECHELFGHPIHGDKAEKLAISVIKQGRKFGITLILDTQSPTATSIPKEVTRNTSCGVAFSVADHIANDGLLGSGKYRAGIRATDLRMHTDRGTSVMVGVSDATFELVRGFYVPYADGVDMVTPVIARAMAAITELRHTGDATDQHDQDDGAEQVDHLANIHTALRGERRVRTQVVLTRLAELNPSVYEGWTFQDLSAALADYDIEPVKSGGVKVVRATDVAHALNYRDRRHATDSDE
ncbi:MAG: hypothetical protein JO296_08060 [Pseudonocardiales bacterium]|nr:hypothetical protein [Pseudonocardiales bacterium]